MTSTPPIESSAAAPKPPTERGAKPLELSIVIPCLNEADTLSTCIRKTLETLAKHSIAGEIIVADNGSTDGSVAIARSEGASVVSVTNKGYGCALKAGIESSHGHFVLMGDADDSYDFRELPKFVEKLRDGFELVQGCRLPRGGGTVLPGAMPHLHRWWGNPMFTLIVRVMFNAPVNDVYCGMRAFTRPLYNRLALRSTGMEFAIEMIIKASLLEARIAEVPITLHPDGRIGRSPHLRTFRDGWRTLRFLLMCSPRWLFLFPGIGLGAMGLLGYALAMPGIRIAGVALDSHTLLASSLMILLGFQLLQFAALSRTFGTTEGFVPKLPRSSWTDRLSFEHAVIIGALAFFVGCALVGTAAYNWYATGFGNLDYPRTMRWVIPGVTLAALGFQTIFSSFFLGILRLGQRN